VTSSRPFLLVGLTGGIATGKSTVDALLRDLGAAIIDADVLARDVVEPGEPALDEIVAEFGRGVLEPGGRLDRKALGAIVFADPERRRKLEAMTHPRIRERFQRQLEVLAARGFRGLVIFDAAVMIESGNYRNMDRLVVVIADEATQIARLMARDGIDRDEALRKIKSQMPLAEKAKLADHVIDNSGDCTTTEAQVVKVHESLMAELEASGRLAGRALPLAALFPINMGHYSANRLAPGAVFAALERQSNGLNFLAYHGNPSGNFVFEDRGSDGLEKALGVGQRVTGLACICRRYPDLVRVWQALPAGTTTIGRSVKVRRNGGWLSLIAVFLSEDVPRDAQKLGELNTRVTALSWVSARDVMCLYDRPAKNGSVGQVRQAVLRTVRQTDTASLLSGTARAMSVIHDMVRGRLKRAQGGGATHAAKP
jgi:dephospho-CoA kinase